VPTMSTVLRVGARSLGAAAAEAADAEPVISRPVAGASRWRRRERLMDSCFAIGAACFFIGPFPGFVQLVGQGADGVVFFAGSLFFTSGGALQLWQATAQRPQRRLGGAAWWSAAVQFAGTLFFNVSTFNAMDTGLSTSQVNHLVWAPDVYGSICFLASSFIAFRASVIADRAAARRQAQPTRRGRGWWAAALNLVGSAFFGISAVASLVVPSSGSMLDLAAANWNTAAGGLCFLVGALISLPGGNEGDRRPLLARIEHIEHLALKEA
jgi:hypothetical protein